MPRLFAWEKSLGTRLVSGCFTIASSLYIILSPSCAEYDTFLNSQVAVMADPQATEVHAMVCI